MEHKGDSDTNCNQCARNDPQKHGRGAERFGNRRTSRRY